MRRLLCLPLLAACQRAPSPAADAGTPAVQTPPAPAPAPAPSRPDAGVRPSLPRDLNVLMISVDSLRADMPWSGYPREIAPALTALEAQSVSFTHAYALSSYTSMSVGGFLGGHVPSELARDGFFFGTYPRRVTFVQELLQRSGIRTLSTHAHGYFRVNKAGFDQGFDDYRLLPGLRWNPLMDEEVTSPRHVETARAMLSDPANSGRRFFAWFHFMDPHDAYRQHEGIAYGRRMRDRYDAEVTFTDRHLGELITWVRAQPWGARTAIIVTADHGECFGEHSHYRHGFELWQELVRVPWFFSIPGVPARRIAANRSHLDLAPTLLELLGAPAEPSLPGHSLVPELLGGPTEEREVVVDLPRTSDNDRRRALIRGRYKLIAYGDDSRFELYDLEADPGELTNLSRTDRARFTEMVARYREVSQGITEVHPYQCRTLHGAPPGRGW